MRLFIFFLITGFLTSCVKKYKRTVRLCDGGVYIEVFNVNPAGVDAAYLTDSTNFRKYLGKWDNEHENLHYLCEGDSVIVEKFAEQGLSETRVVVETQRHSLTDLKTQKKFE